MVAKSELLQKAYAVQTPEEVKNLYRDWASSYDKDLLSDNLSYVAPKEAVKVFARHFDNISAHILDVGCGTGLSGQALASAGYKLIDGVDLSEEMLEQARLKGIYNSLFQADLTAGLKVPDNHYDAVLSVGTFTHGHVGPEGLNEVIRVVKPEGIVCLTVNEGVYEKSNYPDKLEQLAEQQICSVAELVDADYLAGENIRSKIACLKVT